MTDVFRWSSDLVDALAEASPIRATFMGVTGHDDRWDDLSPEGDAARAALFAERRVVVDLDFVEPGPVRRRQATLKRRNGPNRRAPQWLASNPRA